MSRSRGGNTLSQTNETACRVCRSGDFVSTEQERSQGNKGDLEWLGEVARGVTTPEPGDEPFYVFDESWMEETVSVVAKQYLLVAKGAKFSRDKAQQVAEMGGRSVQQAGSYLEAERQIQKCNLEDREQLVKNAIGGFLVFPSNS